MHTTLKYLILLSLFLILPFSSIPIVAGEDITIDIHIINQPTQYRDNTLVMIAGLWHTVTISEVNVDDSIVLTIYQGTTPPEEKNEMNYYQWEYASMTAIPWYVTTGYGDYTIDPLLCQKSSDTITFCIGIPDFLPNEIFYYEEWTIEISDSTTPLYNEMIYLENPTRGFAKSHGDHISFTVDPFAEMDSKASDYLILKNTGNVPLEITLDYNALDTFLTYTESSNEISANDKQIYRLLLRSDSWKPQQIQQPGSARALVSEQYLLDDGAGGTAISLQTAFVIDIPTINVFVGHNSCELTMLDPETGFSFQYQRRLTMKEGETKDIFAYVSGEGTATLSIEGNENISILELTRNGQPIQSPFTILSNDQEEQVIGLKIKALSENNNGQISYKIETEAGTKTFTTYITVNSPTVSNRPSQPVGIVSSPLTLVVLIALIAAAAFMLYNHLVYGRGERR